MLWVLRVSRISRNRSLSNPPLHPQSTDCRKARISISRSSLTQSRATVGLHHSTTADPGNSGILGRSERHYRSGSGSHRYIPVNPLLVSLRTLKPRRAIPEFSPTGPYAGAGRRDSSHRNQSVIPLIMLRPKALTQKLILLTYSQSRYYSRLHGGLAQSKDSSKQSPTTVSPLSPV